MNMLYSDLKDLGNLIYVKVKNKNKTISANSSNYTVARGIRSKTKKIRKTLKTNSKTVFSFKRKPRVKRFKKPIFINF
jgi:hypothetical protein